jgi:tetratricopeptide (TPR) repeat protein
MKNLAAMHLNWEGCEQVSILKSPLYCEFLHSEYTRALTFENLWQDENAVRYTRTAAELTADQMRVLEILAQLEGAADWRGVAAQERAARAVAAAVRTSMPSIASIVYCTLGSAHHKLGNFSKALEHFTQQLTMAKQVGDRAGEGLCG